MNTPVRLVVSGLISLGLFVAAQHAVSALRPAVPRDMPADAHFLPTGFKIENGETEGDWVACREDAAEAADWCRVTDQSGHVVFEGDYLPAIGLSAVPGAALHVADANPKTLWVLGPTEAAPVPVIPLTNGKLLVPAADRDAIAKRWTADPSEYNRVMSSL